MSKAVRVALGAAAGVALAVGSIWFVSWGSSPETWTGGSRAMAALAVLVAGGMGAIFPFDE